MEVNAASIRALFDRVLKLANPLAAEVILSGGSCTVLRFANNRFHQSVRENRLQLYVRVVDGKRMGVAIVDDFSDAELAAAVARAKEVARLSDEDDDILPLPEGRAFSESPGRHDAAKIDLHGLGEQLGAFIARCEEEGFEAAGKLEMVEGTIGDYGEMLPLAMANSRGLFVHAPATWFDFSTTVFTDTASGWGGNGARRLSDVNWESLADSALTKARLNRDQQDLAPGKYKVILEPAAVRTLLGYLFGAFNAQTVEEGRSFLGDKIGQRVFPEWLSLVDDAYHPLLGGSPFDGEGMPVERTPLVDAGVVRGFVNTRALAKKRGEAPTGHGFSLPNPIGGFPMNVVMSGGKDRLLDVDRAILVTRVWYTTPVDEKRLIVSGMTRDGTFLVENGKIVGALRNLRFNQSLPEMLNNVEAVGPAGATSGALVPGLRVRDFHFTSATKF